MFLVKICLFLSFIELTLPQQFTKFADTPRNRERFYKSGRRYYRSRRIFGNYNKNNLQNYNEPNNDKTLSPAEISIQAIPESIQFLTEIPIQSQIEIELNKLQSNQNNACSGYKDNNNNNNNLNIKLPLIFTKATVHNDKPKFNSPDLIQAFLVLKPELKEQKLPRSEKPNIFTKSNWSNLIIEDQHKNNMLETLLIQNPTVMSLDEY